MLSPKKVDDQVRAKQVADLKFGYVHLLVVQHLLRQGVDANRR